MSNTPAQISRNPSHKPIINILIRMKNNAKSDHSIKFVNKALTYISKHANLNRPEEVKAFVANLQTGNGYKKNLCLAYNKFCQYYQIEWTMPCYRPEAKTVKIPTKEKVEMLIARAGKVLSIKLRLSKETGLRPTELCNLKVKDLDVERRTIHPTTAKHGAGRTLKITANLLIALQNHINENRLGNNDKIFKGNADDYGKHYRLMRNKLARKLNDPTLKTIRLYDFRHYYATML